MSSLNRFNWIGTISSVIVGRLTGIAGTRTARDWRSVITSSLIVLVVLLFAFKFFFPVWWAIWGLSWVFWFSMILLFLASTAFQIGRSSRGYIFTGLAIAMSAWYIHLHPFLVWNFHANGNGKEFVIKLPDHYTWKVVPEPSCSVNFTGPNVKQTMWADKDGKVSFKTDTGEASNGRPGQYTIKALSGGEQTITVEAWPENLHNK